MLSLKCVFLVIFVIYGSRTALCQNGDNSSVTQSNRTCHHKSARWSTITDTCANISMVEVMANLRHYRPEKFLLRESFMEEGLRETVNPEKLGEYYDQLEHAERQIERYENALLVRQDWHHIFWRNEEWQGLRSIIEEGRGVLAVRRRQFYEEARKKNRLWKTLRRYSEVVYDLQQKLERWEESMNMLQIRLRRESGTAEKELSRLPKQQPKPQQQQKRVMEPFFSFLKKRERNWDVELRDVDEEGSGIGKKIVGWFANHLEHPNHTTEASLSVSRRKEPRRKQSPGFFARIIKNLFDD